LKEQTDFPMMQYSIRELEHLSGIKAHTLRIWEQRYGIIQPQRTSTNIRYYSNDDLKLILKIALLNQHGYKISKIAKMQVEELSIQFSMLMQDIGQHDFQIGALTTAMIDLNENGFEEIMIKNINHHGFEKTMIDIVYPFLEKIGILWLSGSINPAQEHFMSNLIRQKIIVGIDKLEKKESPDSDHFLLFLPENELHELGLLFAHYALKKRGYKVTYLGANVPLKDVVEITRYKKINRIFAILTSAPNNKKIKPFVQKLSSNLAGVQIFLTGYQASRINFLLSDNVKIIHKVTDLIPLNELKISNYSNGDGIFN